jgi:hypothetical protein
LRLQRNDFLRLHVFRRHCIICSYSSSSTASTAVMKIYTT